MSDISPEAAAEIAKKFTPHDGYSEHPLTNPRDDDRAGSQLGRDDYSGYRDAWAYGEDDDDGLAFSIFD